MKVLFHGQETVFSLILGTDKLLTQNLRRKMDSPIKSGNDERKKFKCLLAGLIISNEWARIWYLSGFFCR